MVRFFLFKQKTAYEMRISDWSSDVCSSDLLVKQGLMSILDLGPREILVFAPLVLIVLWMGIYPLPFLDAIDVTVTKLVADYNTALSAPNLQPVARSEERRVGNECVSTCRSRWSP